MRKGEDGLYPIGWNFYRHLCMSNFNDITITIRGVEPPPHLELVHALYPWQKPLPSDKPSASLSLVKGGKPEYVSHRLHWEDPDEAKKMRMLAMEFEARRGNVMATVQSSEKDNIVPFPK